MESICHSITEITLKGDDAREYIQLLQNVKASNMPEWQKQWAKAELEEIAEELRRQIAGSWF